MRWRPGAALHREREQCAASLGPAQRVSLRQGCVPRVHHLGPQRGGESRQDGTKAAAHYALDVPGRRQQDRPPASGGRQGSGSPSAVSTRSSRAGSPTPTSSTSGLRRKSLTEDERRVHRQALAGMLWSKQYYYFDLDRWLQEHRSHPLLESARHGVRNTEWFHMLNADVISMPDKWEYPWYAAWDLAFHTISLSLVDFDFAKEQLLLMLRSLYAHPNGQIPAYEWNFSDVNPPVHAWATLFLYKMRAEPRPGGPAVPGTIVSGADAELQLVGQPQGPRRAQRVRRRISRVSTTSASSIAARSSPPAARWSRRTARPGWRSTARACWRSPSS